MEWFNAIQDAIVAAGASPWVLVAVLGLCFIDGFFPPLPSESIIIGLAALTVQGDGQPLILVFLMAATGAWLGDQMAYFLGSKIPISRIRFLNEGRGGRAFARAGHQLTQNAPLYIFAARFIPVGRMAVNMCAGAIRYRRPAFMLIDGISVMVWAAYSIAVGVGAAHILEDKPLASMALGIAGGVFLGWILNHILNFVLRRWFPERYAAAQETERLWAERQAQAEEDHTPATEGSSRA